MSVIGLIPARGGSNRVPRKHLRPLGGKPVIAWTIEAGLASRTINRVIVTTDDEEIARVSRKHGAEIPFLRPKELAGDGPTLGLAVRHAYEFLTKEQGEDIDLLVILFPTCPFRMPEQIDEAVHLMQGDEQAIQLYCAWRPDAYPNRCVHVVHGKAKLAVAQKEKHWTPVWKINQAITVSRWFEDGTTLDVRSSLGVIAYNKDTLKPYHRIALFIDEVSAIDIDNPIDYFRAQVALKYGLLEKRT